MIFSQTLAFLTRSIRQESRLLTHHVVRGSLVLLTLLLFFSQVIEAPRRGASGLYLVKSISDCCYFCLTLLGIMYFSLAITEEKEEETLPLLRMTGVRNFTLLIGKSLPRLALVVLLILVSAPFLLLSITLGGVIPAQIIALIAGMMCYAFCLSQIGLFSSTICRSSQRAVSLTFLLWIVLEFGSWFLWLLAYGSQQWNLTVFQNPLYFISETLWRCSMWSASAEFLMFERGDSIWHPQMIFHGSVGLVFFGLSWAMFEFVNQASLAQGAAASETVARSAATQTRGVQSLRCWNAAMVWKSWQFLVGGWLWIAVYTVGLPLFALGVVLLVSLIVGETASAPVYGVTLMIVGGVSFVILQARLFGNVLNREIYQKTLVSICMLPRPRWAAISELYTGLLPGLFAPLWCFALGILWTGSVEPSFFGDLVEVIAEPWFWTMLGWLAVTTHIGTLLSVYLRHGAMLIAIAMCWFLAPFVFGMVFGMIAMLFNGLGAGIGEFVFRFMIPLGFLAVETVVCLLIHRWILYRFEELAAR